MPRKDYSDDPRLEGVARWLYSRIIKEREIFHKEHGLTMEKDFRQVPLPMRQSWYDEASSLLAVVDS